MNPLCQNQRGSKILIFDASLYSVIRFRCTFQKEWERKQGQFLFLRSKVDLMDKVKINAAVFIYKRHVVMYVCILIVLMDKNQQYQQRKEEEISA